MRSATPSADLSDRRVQTLIQGVLLRLDQPRQACRPWTAAWQILRTPLPRYAAQMLTAALFGVLFGSAIPQNSDTGRQPPLVSLISASAPSQPLGF
jgi:hypothetical protein